MASNHCLSQPWQQSPNTINIIQMICYNYFMGKSCVKVHEFSLLQEDINKILNIGSTAISVICNLMQLILITTKPSHHFLHVYTALENYGVYLQYIYRYCCPNTEILYYYHDHYYSTQNPGHTHLSYRDSTNNIIINLQF